MYANPDTPHHAHSPTVGSLFAGIGGFDLGFERAGFRTAWQVEIDPIRRAVLADRFPHAQRFDDVRACGRHNLLPVDVIVGGFPCQDLSTMGKRAGLAGERSGLFYEVVRIINELRPRWLVLENVTGLLSCNDGEDFAAVIGTLAECGYLGFWRVLNAQYFGVPTKRRRVFMVAGLGCQPPVELLADAGPVDSLPRAPKAQQTGIGLAGWAYPTLLAGSAPGQINLGGSGLVAVEDGWGAMAERSRTLEHHGLCKGLDAANFAEAQGAGNAVSPPVAEWVARHLIEECA
ncbi:DNA cytosine methyltransferase [Ralstonia pseudosolanacearum]|uniref:Cytosine-specific methyltransferase n=1 Tax=Ralstonia pseudosolanacearum TaxID=1310165 RepID=A0A454TSS0_9RALS|nr:DNA cytosine methyltransferase [Ralstonia pseudosolanacearum]AXW01386.1 DNA cytosine methyltransferase [Ralstonia solanacearum]AXW28864.1 DNA cytosine methyltransferase [Ralstonia solanacearum]AXW47629.1 DNA cytosine methyltransferase [Ralstonia solanacearum]MCK4133228.1 DNA cytosine methyltransferase [Ralstonia pseudosolanacearum]MDK1380796.1 DNA cytosine methyltransferase [Ralstonia pseudosolanacearum]